jgi:peptide-methionine (S)-S-oxide reductase
MDNKLETAVLAGGCFWGMQELMRRKEGVSSSRVGWTGGDTPDPTEASPGDHAEAVELHFDPELTSFREILELFFQIHDPTTPNRQMDDVGTEYRSAIFYADDEQRRVAVETIAEIEASGLWPGTVVTQVVPAGRFWEAEPDDQLYLQKNPDGEICHFPRPGWRLPQRQTTS